MLICIKEASKRLKLHPLTIRRWCKHLKLSIRYWTGPDGKGPARKRACLSAQDYTTLAIAMKEWRTRKRVMG